MPTLWRHNNKYDLKGHWSSEKAPSMLTSFYHTNLWTDYDENLYQCYSYKDATFYRVKYDIRGYERWNFLSKIKTLTYFVMDNFCPCFSLSLCTCTSIVQ